MAESTSSNNAGPTTNIPTQVNNQLGVSTVADEMLDSPEPASLAESILWYCAGADHKLLIKCMNSDRVKYQGLGGIVMATGLLAFIAMAFAINVVFFEGVWGASVSTVVVPVILGLLWGLIIFNLDRFIISSTGKGDGTELITSSEIISALPRIVMALVIALSISAPLEIVVFEKEINKRFAEINEDKFNKQKIAFEKSNLSDIKIFDDQIKVKLYEKAEQDEIYKKNEDKVAFEISNGGCKGKCDEFKALMKKAEQKSLFLKSEIDNLQKKVDEINTEKKYKLNDFESKMNQKPALLERLLLLEEIPGSKMPVLILRLLFIVIEVGPLFFKMMLTKSTYDHLKHQYDEMVLARNGIFENEELVPGLNDGIAEKFYVYGNVALLNHQNKITLEEQRRIDQQILTMWQNYMAKEMSDNPQRFMSWLQENSGKVTPNNSTVNDNGTEKSEVSAPQGSSPASEVQSSSTSTVETDLKNEQPLEPVANPVSDIKTPKTDEKPDAPNAADNKLPEKEPDLSSDIQKDDNATPVSEIQENKPPTEINEAGNLAGNQLKNEDGSITEVPNVTENIDMP